MQNTFSTDSTPVSSHTRQSIAAAAARAAENVDMVILMKHAANIAMEEHAKLPGPVLRLPPPTAEEMRATIPEHGIMLAELFERLHLAQVIKDPSNFHVFKDAFQSVAVQDPVTQLIFPLPVGTTKNISRWKKGTKAFEIVNRSKREIALAADRAAQNPDDHIFFMGSALSAAREARRNKKTKSASPPTLKQVRAAIPDDGILVTDLVRLFYPRIKRSGVRNREAVYAFVAQVKAVAKQDLSTGLIFPKK